MAIAIGDAGARARDERRFFSGMALALLAFTFVAFAPTYYLYPLFDLPNTRGVRAADALTPLVHAHGIATAAWIVLLFAQTALIAAHRTDLHRKVGSLGVVAIAAVIVTSVAVSLHAGRAGSAPPGWTAPQFLLIQIGSLGGFVVLATLGLWFRRRADVHKRLMLLATIAMLLPAAGRISRFLDVSFLPPGTRGGMVLQSLFVVALAAYDLRTRGRLHRATLWGGGAVLLAMPLRYFGARTETWESVGRAILS
jgi:hypothetical protein